MQKRPLLFEEYHLRRRFSGILRMGSRDVWAYSGNFIDFNGGRNNRHRHSYYEVCLVLGGGGRFDYGSDSIALKAGDLFVAEPGMDHEIISDIEDTLKIQFISFSFSGRPGDSGKADGMYDVCIDSFLTGHSMIIAGANAISSHFSALADLNSEDNDLKWYLHSEGIIRMLILDIIFRTVNADIYGEIPVNLDNRLECALGYMNDNPQRSLSVDEIAAHANTSPRTLRRLFRNEWEMTVVEKSSEIRINAAGRWLLGHPDDSVSETAYRFGFMNPSDFGRMFKKVTGLSPGEFRARRGTIFQ